MTKRVLFLIPRDSMSDAQRNYYRSLYPEVEFASADPYNPMKIAREKLREGIEIIAGRGNTAVVIRREMPDIHVVEIPITGYDIIHSLGHTDFKGKTIAVITNNAEIIGLELFEQLYQVKILSYILVPFSELDRTIRDARARGAAYIIGGAVTCKAARELGAPARMIFLGPESMAQAVHEIRQVQGAIEVEAQRLGFIDRLIDNIAEGVLSVDLKERITFVNANAARMMGIKQNQAVGQPLAAVLKTAGLPASLLEGADEAGRLIEVGQDQLMTTRIPIMSRKKYYGTIYTLHEPKRIASMEHSIRKAAYEGQSRKAYYQFSDLIGESDEMRKAVRTGLGYAKTDASILITGETGTGKELFAQSIHNASPRKKEPFVAVNCAALPETLLESELFGYVEGAFTGATRKGRPGLFETAHRGTIFLDEISEMSYASQGSLLRVIQEKYVVRLGSLKLLPVDVRIIAASNRDLYQLVEEGKFRQDLFYRLNVLSLLIPPLRARNNDAIQILLRLLNGAEASRGHYTIEETGRALLAAYHWPGNVREVCNLAERILATEAGPRLDAEQLQQLIGARPTADAAPGLTRKIRQTSQRHTIEQALKESCGNLGHAAQLLGIDRSTLWRRMRKLGMQ